MGISINEAIEYFGFSNDSSFYSIPKYMRFTSRAVRGKDGKKILRNASFDLNGYLDFKEKENYVIAQAGLLLEYAIHEKKIKTSELIAITGVHKGAIYACDLSPKSAIGMLRGIEKHRDDIMEGFCTHYNIPYTPNRNKVKWSIWNDGYTQ